MSKSPKYTTAHFTGPSQAELELQRRAREAERRRQAEEARRQRQQAERAAIAGQVTGLRGRASQLAAEAAATGLGDRQVALLGKIDALAPQAGTASTDRDLQAARERLGELQREADGIAAAAAGILAARERERALAMVRASLADIPDRAEHDAEGAAGADRMLAEAESKLADPAGFAAAHARLAAAVQAHLDRVRARRAELARMREEAAAAASELRAVLDEAADAELDLAGAGGASELLARLEAAAGAGDVPLARSLTGQARHAGEDLVADFDRKLDQLERARLVLEAVAKALPKAGLRLVGGSDRFDGTTTSFRVLRADGAPLDVAVVPDDADGVQIEYRADGADFVVTQTADGEAAECPSTEDLIGRFHDELTAWGVSAGELLWEGKPGYRPDRRQERAFYEQHVRSQEHR